MIVTAGGIDAHIHFICPQQIDEALMSGVTTMIGGGTGPATGTVRDDVHAGPVAHPPDARGGRGVSDEPRLSRQGQREPPAAAGRAGRGRRDRPQAARGLGHDAGRDRRRAQGRRQDGRAGRDPHRHAERIRASSRRRSTRSAAARSTRITPKARAAATRPTSSRRAASRTCCRRRPIRRARTPSTRSTSTSTC